MIELLLSLSAKNTDGIPGPDKLISGNMDVGYFGLVSATEFATATEVTLAAGAQLPAGNDDTPWVKMMYKNKVIFYPQKMINNYTYSYLATAMLLNGTKEITIKGWKFNIRCMNATLDGTYGGTQTNSEYSNLICRMCTQVTPIEVGPKLANFTTTELGIGSMYTMTTGSSAGRGVAVGSASNLALFESPAGNSSRGWRPVLEWVG